MTHNIKEEPLLLTPGPLTTSQSVKESLVKDWGSRDPRFIHLNQKIRDRLLDLAGGRDTHVCVPLQGSGTFAVEATLGTLTPKSSNKFSKTLVLVNGAYGRRMVSILKAMGRRYVFIETPEDVPSDLQRLKAVLGADQEITHVAMVHCETTTGMLNPLKEVAEIVCKSGRKFILDAMSSFGALSIDLREIPCDAVVASSNKCLEGVPGVGFSIIKKSTLEECEDNAHSLSLDLYAQWKGFEKNGQWRFTPPTQVLASFLQALEEHKVEGGVMGRGERYRQNSQILISGMREMGFKTFLPDAFQAPIIITFKIPNEPRFQFKEFYDRLSDLGYVIYPGKLTAAETFRMGCIGHLDGDQMRGALKAVRQVLEQMDIRIPVVKPRCEEAKDRSLEVNGKSYIWPKAPVVVVCMDGSPQEYLDKAIQAGVMPYFKSLKQNPSTHLLADCVMPSFTNPNNLSIITGVPPSVHGISGNFFYDPDQKSEVMMNDPQFLRCETILASFSNAGAQVAAVTAKDKLRRLLGHGWKGVCFSAEKASEVTLEQNGIENVLELTGLAQPEVYSADLSRFVMAVGAALLETRRPDVLYLSTTDYIQHKHAPGTPEANAFYQMLDHYIGRLDALGATVVVTADHGMSAKTDAQNQPNVIYLQTKLGEIAEANGARVILPITDPYVVHHGALGSYATIYLPKESHSETVAGKLKAIAGILEVFSKEEAVERFELPKDRIGDLVVVSESHYVLGTSEDRHDLSQLKVPLRSHGGVSEQEVPLIMNREAHGLQKGVRLRNFSAFDLALNYTSVNRT